MHRSPTAFLKSGFGIRGMVLQISRNSTWWSSRSLIHLTAASAAPLAAALQGRMVTCEKPNNWDIRDIQALRNAKPLFVITTSGNMKVEHARAIKYLRVVSAVVSSTGMDRVNLVKRTKDNQDVSRLIERDRRPLWSKSLQTEARRGWRRVHSIENGRENSTLVTWRWRSNI